VEKDQGIKFQEEIGKLKKRFPRQKIEILDEGCGLSTLADELEQPNVHISKSDLVHSVSPKKFHKVSVHDLAKHFGKNRFHLIISTRGGVDWGGDYKNAIANIYATLKPRGKAFITATANSELMQKCAQDLGITYKGRWNGIILFK